MNKKLLFLGMRSSVLLGMALALGMALIGCGNTATYTISFDSQGGSAVEAVTVSAGDTIRSMKTPTRDGFAFGGWYTNKECTTAFTAMTPVNGDMTVYAKWTTAVTVIFDSNGGSPVEPKVVAEGASIGTLSEPTKESFGFAGWYTDNTTFANEFTSATKVSGNITVYAKWIATKIVTTNVGTLVLIKAGTFMMGSPEGEQFHDDNEIQHEVTLTKGFYMGEYEITQAQYESVMLYNPSTYNGPSYPPADGEDQGKRPVEQVRWYDAIVFCNTLSMKENLTPAYSIGGSTDPADWGTVPASNDSDWDAVICDWTADG
ncbi:MAG: InlB B-repeat-containing protein, partial [Spirochaetaceae bacterium]|nr:InlB B-repeat-containing protein [Spirochaetaceae bacterium]